MSALTATIVYQGANLLLETVFNGGPAVPLYIGIITGAFTFTLDDTMASHSWTEWTAAGGSRPLWVPGTVANGYVDNFASKPVWGPFGGGETRWDGAFLSSSPTLGGTTGVLFGVGRADTRIAGPGDRGTIAIGVQLTGGMSGAA